ncbi:MAG: UDP-N-acetylmuramoylalanine-D-glutamate ligase [Parcubacteria group bacterium GW2011_GWA2_45_30]|nr:MAG: UDP-N-acetylmuramoylalanine-D-glutamate ligase [Parcubacteria group bacterium GW2011_GWA2_45_30]
MNKSVALNFSGKKVLVMGLGIQGGGLEAVKFLWRNGVKITVTDLRSRWVLKKSIRQLRKYRGIHYVLGGHRKSDFKITDFVLKNPGVPPHSLYLRYAKGLGIPILTDIGIFLRFCPAPVIGITGTRGKSTAAYLIWKFLQKRGLTRTKREQTQNIQYKRVFLSGNIGKSPLGYLPLLKKNDLVVLELSSFQLEDLASEHKSPQIAVVTNIYRDHLNWHKNFREYIAAKRSIVRYQTPEDYAFVNSADLGVRKMTHGINSRIRSVKLPNKFRAIVDKNIGVHYRQIVALAVAVGTHLGVPLRRMLKILKGFRGLPGRQEKIGTIRGVHFINDTTATIPDATVAALRRFHALKKPAERIILIAGGSDKKLDFSVLAKEILYKVDTLILLPGDATEKLKKILLLEHNQATREIIIKEVKTMHDAVKSAYLSAKNRDWILLSPGAASFGLFLNEFDRGRQFVEEVKKMQ